MKVVIGAEKHGLECQPEGPHRGGPFKEAFQHQMIFVYGSGERWPLQLARFDAETFWYRGNGSVTFLSDQEFLERKLLSASTAASFVWNASNNSAWRIAAQISDRCRGRPGTPGRPSLGARRLALLFFAAPSRQFQRMRWRGRCRERGRRGGGNGPCRVFSPERRCQTGVFSRAMS